MKTLGLTSLALILLVSVTGAAPFAYITTDSNTVSIIDTATNKIASTVDVGSDPSGVAVNPSGTKVYVTNSGSNTVSVINTTTNIYPTSVKVGSDPLEIAVTPNGKTAYVVNSGSNTVSVINTATNTVTDTVNVGKQPEGIAIAPDGKTAYVTNWGSGTICVIDIATNTVTAIVSVGSDPLGVTVTPDGNKVYVANSYSDTVSVIDTATNTITDTVNVGNAPIDVVANLAGTDVYVTNHYDNTVSVIDTTTNTVTDTVSAGYRPSGVSITPNGQRLYVVCEDSNVYAINTTTNKIATVIMNVGAYWELGQFIGPLIAPVTNFSAYPTSGKAPLTVTFTDKSINSPTSWKWSFGDGTTSTVKNPTHTYSNAGSYTVAHTATNAAGSNKITKTNYIIVKTAVVKPVAAFSASPISGKAPLNVKFTDTSTGLPTSWKWDFGDGSKTFHQNPTHKYSKAGVYTVSLTVKNAKGSNTVTKTNYIKVVTKPVAAFSATPTSGKVPLKVQFTDKSTGVPTSWKWDFGDGSKSFLQNPTHKYSKAGTYTVSLTVKNAAGNSSVTKSKYITVK